MLTQAIEKLLAYANETGLMPVCENIYAANRLLALFRENSFEGSFTPAPSGEPLESILKELLDEADARGLLPENTVTYRDLFDAEIMNILTPRPSQVIGTFEALYREKPEKATDWFYKFSQDTDYIRRYRLCRDVRYAVDSAYGPIEITINLSKPEKDPKDIAAAKLAPQSGYPKCLLCMENEGYAGRANHPGRANHRIIPMQLSGEDWGFQYSPYGYYNEHCILLNKKHIPMKIEEATFRKLLDFVELMPHYMLGSNADLPIVGGSILSHDHYQGGRHDFPMALAPIEESFDIPGSEGVRCGLVHWPLTCLRLNGSNKQEVIRLAVRILDAWRAYSDPSLFIFAETDGEKHNTVTPIARMHNGEFELDLVLRNNITTPERPLGVYHPRPAYHHIKKENIGLIEVMGLAVLPARLKTELKVLEEAILAGKDLHADPATAMHAAWAESWLPHYRITAENAEQIIREEVGRVFVGVLEDAGVYKTDEAGRAGVRRFIASL